jgi:signal transduction histidine kinase/ActR/RegA family two-component response regulator
VPDRDLETTSGKKLTLVNPAYMTRMVQELSRETYGIKGHITSLHPIRPENAPDAWEHEALTRIEAGEPEVMGVALYEGTPHLRYVGQLALEARCLKCHPTDARYRTRGGLSVSVPLAAYEAAYASERRGLAAFHGASWLLGLAAIAVGGLRTRARAREREQAAAAVAAAQARRAEARRLEAVGELAGGFAHDVNNLLSPILGHAEMALQDVPPGSVIAQDLEQIGLAARRARDLTRRLLAFSRRSVLARRPVDLSELVLGLEVMLRQLVGERVALQIAAAPGLPAVMADTAELEVALVNLAVNARDAMPDGGTLRVLTGAATLTAPREDLPAGRYVTLEVADTGTGMDADTLERIFDPFFTTKPDGKGNGLGLASVQGAVRQHGGAISVRSAPGQGSSFTVLLPACDAAPEHLGAGPGEAPRGTETVLVAEDDAGVRQFVTAALRGLGYQVLEAEDGEAALRASAAHPGPVHLLLSDAVMPRLSGRELWERLRARRPGARVVFMSGYTSEVFRLDVAGAPRDVLAKPFTPAELARAIRRALDRGPDAVPPAGADVDAAHVL